jgi:hypothetical protein
MSGLEFLDTNVLIYSYGSYGSSAAASGRSPGACFERLWPAAW